MYDKGHIDLCGYYDCAESFGSNGLHATKLVPTNRTERNAKGVTALGFKRKLKIYIKEMENNIQAFPRPHSDSINAATNGYGPLLTLEAQDGMTLLDYFAAKAMQGIITDRSTAVCGIYHSERIANDAYGIASAMIEARKNYIK